MQQPPLWVWRYALADGCWCLVVGFWLLVVACWLLAVGCWLVGWLGGWVVGCSCCLCCCCCCCCCWYCWTGVWWKDDSFRGLQSSSKLVAMGSDSKVKLIARTVPWRSVSSVFCKWWCLPYVYGMSFGLGRWTQLRHKIQRQTLQITRHVFTNSKILDDMTWTLSAIHSCVGRFGDGFGEWWHLNWKRGRCDRGNPHLEK